MLNETKSIEVNKDSKIEAGASDQIQQTRVYVPKADIFETEKNFHIITDLPGVRQDDLDITVEKNILQISAKVGEVIPDGYSLDRMEYRIGDFRRKFILSDEIDRERIEAVFNDGVLRLRLPKAQSAVMRKITVKRGK
jgi:HSP20 family molecular chaperone IbpA